MCLNLSSYCDTLSFMNILKLKLSTEKSHFSAGCCGLHAKCRLAFEVLDFLIPTQGHTLTTMSSGRCLYPNLHSLWLPVLPSQHPPPFLLVASHWSQVSTQVQSLSPMLLLSSLLPERLVGSALWQTHGQTDGRLGWSRSAIGWSTRCLKLALWHQGDLLKIQIDAQVLPHRF